MKTEYTIFRPGDAAVERGEVDWPDEPGYDQIQTLIEPLLDGAGMEHVTVLHNGKRADTFVDELSTTALKPGYPLPRNERATAIYRTNWLTQHPDCDPETLPIIAGPAVLFDRRVWF